MLYLKATWVKCEHTINHLNSNLTHRQLTSRMRYMSVFLKMNFVNHQSDCSMFFFFFFLQQITVGVDLPKIKGIQFSPKMTDRNGDEKIFRNDSKVG